MTVSNYEAAKQKRKYTIELIDGSKLYASKWSSKISGIWPAMTSTMMTEVEDAIFERKDQSTTQHKKMYIPMTSILVAYESKE
jgi:hypothetical protein